VSGTFGATLFSDLGPGGSYSTIFIVVDGSGAFPGDPGVNGASMFTAAGRGSEAISQIDLGAYNPYPGTFPTMTFTASIWSDNSGVPGTELPGASWNFTNDAAAGALVSITGISDVSLTGGDQYFMVLAPLNLADDSYVGWFINSQGSSNTVLIGENGGAFWAFDGTDTEIFDVQGIVTPEPGTGGILSISLAGLLLLARFRRAAAIKTSTAIS